MKLSERTVTIELPWPPTANRYWRIVNNRVVTSRDGRQYQRDVADIVWQQLIQCKLKTFGKDKITLLKIEAYPPDSRRRDIDNLIKPTIDALKLAGLFEDDSQIQAIAAAWARDKDGNLICKPGGMLVISCSAEI